MHRNQSYERKSFSDQASLYSEYINQTLFDRLVGGGGEGWATQLTHFLQAIVWPPAYIIQAQSGQSIFFVQQ